MFIPQLNHMRDAHVEMLQPVAITSTIEELMAFIEREIVEPYHEPGEGCYSSMTWKKSFRKGGPLEWHNPPSNFGPPNIVDVGTVEEWVLNAAQSAR